jgi:hypothetical protein
MTVYPAGTSIWNIRSFDRGTKVYFKCTHCPQYEYRSKDPFVSQWFPANELTEKLSWGGTDECSHTLKNSKCWVTSREYTSTGDDFPHNSIAL